MHLKGSWLVKNINLLIYSKQIGYQSYQLSCWLSAHALKCLDNDSNVVWAELPFKVNYPITNHIEHIFGEWPLIEQGELYKLGILRKNGFALLTFFLEYDASL